MKLFATMLAMSVCMLCRAAENEGKNVTLLQAASTYLALANNGSVVMSKLMDIDDDNNMISLKIANVEQVNKTGSNVQTEDLNTHKFVGGSAKNVTAAVAGAEARRIVVKNAAASDFAVIEITIDIFTESKNITVGDEKTMVSPGDVAVMISLSKYTFKDDENKLKVGLMVMGSASKLTELTDSKATDGKAYNLGGSGVLLLPQQVKSGAAAAAAYVAGAVEVDGNMATVTFVKGDVQEYRFFINLATVDKKDDGNTDASSTLSSLSFLVLTAIALGRCFL